SLYTCDYSALSFNTYDAHSQLPSFPTRRSSDLQLWRAGCPPAGIVRPPAGLRGRPPAGLAARRGGAGRCRTCGNRRHHSPDSLRSEEHTSELQSREKLVCRLLLEKKKKYYIAQN